MKKGLLVVWTLFVVVALGWGQQPKYVFYFIGDGMGVNQVNGTEAYLAELEGRIGIKPLLFSSFPAATMATTYSATNGVTDSAASGTALATSQKTKNGTLGMLPDGKTPVSSLAVWAHQAGARVGIATSVSVDHATPASFYAHQPGRSDYYAIGKDLIEAGFEFYAGSDFQKPIGKKVPEEGSLYSQCEKAGYTLARGIAEFAAKSDDAQKMILFQSEEASRTDRTAIPYAINRREGDLTLTQITRAAIDFLDKGGDEGFFLMVEGGKIDWACHVNDAATAFREVMDLDSAVSVAYDFYKKHPDETLIVVTADHETGGLVLGTGKYELNLQALQHQRVSVDRFSRILNGLRQSTGNQVTWEQVELALRENFGFWEHLKLSKKQEARLRKVFDDTFVKGQVAYDQSLYQKDERLATVACAVMNEIAMVGWVSGSHSNGYVPVYAIGAGADMFHGRTDNAEIPLKMAEAAGWLPLTE